MRVDDPSALPLSNTATATANDKVFGIDFSGGMGSVFGQINAALTEPAWWLPIRRERLRILDDGAGNIVNVNSLSATATVTSLTGGSAELPFFTDGRRLIPV